MPRIALCLEYDGTPFHGWQKQPGLSTVQETLAESIKQLAGHPVDVIAAGRTDKGVHALNMVVHFDTHKEYELQAFIFGLNHFLPPSIRVQAAKFMPADFHARFCAKARRYHYLILNRPVTSALFSTRVFWHPIPLNEVLMQEAAQYLLGTHDFSSFRAADCQAHSPIKTIRFCKVHRKQDFICIDIEADGFLHNMVRNITGVLVKIGGGRQPITWMAEVLSARDRQAAAMKVPAAGLYFKEVQYPLLFELDSWRSAFNSGALFS